MDAVVFATNIIDRSTAPHGETEEVERFGLHKKVAFEGVAGREAAVATAFDHKTIVALITERALTIGIPADGHHLTDFQLVRTKTVSQQRTALDHGCRRLLTGECLPINIADILAQDIEGGAAGHAGRSDIAEQTLQGADTEQLMGLLVNALDEEFKVLRRSHRASRHLFQHLEQGLLMGIDCVH